MSYTTTNTNIRKNISVVFMTAMLTINLLGINTIRAADKTDIKDTKDADRSALMKEMEINIESMDKNNTTLDSSDNLDEHIKKLLENKPEILKNIEETSKNNGINPNMGSVENQTKKPDTTNDSDITDSSDKADSSDAKDSSDKTVSSDTKDSSGVKDNLDSSDTSNSNSNSNTITTDTNTSTNTEKSDSNLDLNIQKAKQLLIQAKEQQQQAQAKLDNLNKKYQPIFDAIKVAKNNMDVASANKKLADKIVKMKKNSKEVINQANENYKLAQDNLNIVNTDDVNNWLKSSQAEVDTAAQELNNMNSLVEEIQKTLDELKSNS